MYLQAECLDNATRAKGTAIHDVVVGLFRFVNTFATPVASKNIQYNYIFFFVAWDVIESIVWYFFAVETVGRTLEGLAEVFEAPVHIIISLIRISCVLIPIVPRTPSRLQSRRKLSLSGRTVQPSLWMKHKT